MTYSIAIEGCFIGMISLLAFTIGRVFFDAPEPQRRAGPWPSPC